MASAAIIETPSGKGAGDENFQVGSILLPAPLRPHVMAFYAFVRAADDVADNGALDPEDKLQRLRCFERALDRDVPAGADFPKARALRTSLAATGVTSRHARDLLRAFMQDARKRRYDDWPDLVGYCRLSASPVGRFLLDLHGEDRALWRFSDPLCDALQVLNHVQDCKADYLNLDRVYLPLDAFAARGIGVEALAAPAADRRLRGVLDDTLDRTGALLERAGPLPRALRSRRLAAESAVILTMARHLLGRLRRRDPIAGRVELGRAAFAGAAAVGLAGVVWQRARTWPPASSPVAS